MSEAAEPPDEQNLADEAVASYRGMGRASTILAAGTVVSRILGFVRAAVLVSAIGSIAAGDAFGAGIQLPNNIYALIAGGVLSAVLVPQIVRAAAHADGGQQYINRIVTLGIVVFAAVTVTATLLAPVLVRLYTTSSSDGRGLTPEAVALATAFAYWCLPQIFFYSLYSLLSEVLNARHVFGPFTWAPVLNNVVSILGLLGFIVLFGAAGSNKHVADWDAGKIAYLGIVTTAAIASQALVLFLFWRRAGLRYRPDFRWRGVGLGATGKAAGWLFGMILVTQLAGIVQTKVSTMASGNDPSVFVLQNAWLIFILPHSVVAVSVATAYFPRMSGHASEGNLVGMRQDLSASLRSIGLLIVFAMVAIAVVAYPFARFFIITGFGDVAGMANVILAFMPGLVLFSTLFVLQRVFYALGDTRTPFLMQLVQAAVFVGGALLCSQLPVNLIAVCLAAVTSIAGSAQAIVAIVLVRRRLGGIDGRLLWRRHLQYLGFSLVAGAVGIAVLTPLGGFNADGFAQSGKFGALVTIVVIGAVMSIVYFGLLTLVRNPELSAVVETATARLRRKG